MLQSIDLLLRKCCILVLSDRFRDSRQSGCTIAYEGSKLKNRPKRNNSPKFFPGAVPRCLYLPRGLHDVHSNDRNQTYHSRSLIPSDEINPDSKVANFLLIRCTRLAAFMIFFRSLRRCWSPWWGWWGRWDSDRGWRSATALPNLKFLRARFSELWESPSPPSWESCHFLTRWRSRSSASSFCLSKALLVFSNFVIVFLSDLKFKLISKSAACEMTLSRISITAFHFSHLNWLTCRCNRKVPRNSGSYSEEEWHYQWLWDQEHRDAGLAQPIGQNWVGVRKAGEILTWVLNPLSP